MLLFELSHYRQISGLVNSISLWLIAVTRSRVLVLKASSCGTRWGSGVRIDGHGSFIFGLMQILGRSYLVYEAGSESFKILIVLEEHVRPQHPLVSLFNQLVQPALSLICQKIVTWNAHNKWNNLLLFFLDLIHLILIKAILLLIWRVNWKSL